MALAQARAPAAHGIGRTARARPAAPPPPGALAMATAVLRRRSALGDCQVDARRALSLWRLAATLLAAWPLAPRPWQQPC